MITIGLNQTINKIPRSLYNWLKKREDNFSEIEFQIYFSAYKSEDDKEAVINEQLGIKVSYYSNPDNETQVRAEGSKIYFSMPGPDAGGSGSSQFLEGFSKDAGASLKEAIEKDFLSHVDQGQCFVEISEDTPAYQKAVISYPDTPCSDGGPAFTCHACPDGYSRTNGLSYFIYYKNHPGQYFFYSIGQFSLLMGAPAANPRLEWFNNVEFVE